MKQATLMVMAAALAAGCGGTHEAPTEARGAATTVQVAPAELRKLAETIQVGGLVKARTVAVLTSRTVGQVRQIVAQPGARVRQGALLAVLDGREMDANRERADALLTAALQSQTAADAERAAAEAHLKLATATHARVERLRERQAATAQEFDEAQAALSAAQARAAAAAASAAAAAANLQGARAGAEGARVAADYSRIVAPFDGVITQRHLDPGAMTMPGTPVLTIEQAGGYVIEAQLDEARAARVDWSLDPQVVLPDAGGEEMTRTGKVVERAFALDASHTVVVKVAVPDAEQVRTGMFARVLFAGPARRVLTIPADAVVQRGQLDAVFVVEADRATYRVIETGQRAGDRAEVRAGLAAGERVIRAVPASLNDGTPVTVAGGGR